jgi:sigma-B regulation protein RsbU (phosphoserine phosphatase)
MLPKLSGYDLCKRARGEGFSSPILMLSARSQEGDRVLGLDLGANDYVSKPFSLRELLARVRALLRHEREHHQDEERLNRELAMAATVQQELFPKVLPVIPGIDYAGVCLPARGVSGDYYDFLPLADRKLGLLLADVSGKGMAAALLGASLHAAFRAGATVAHARCGEVLAGMNRILYESTTADRYATVFYGVYDPDTRTLSFANAGHNSPIIVRGEKSIPLDSLTPPLGMFPALPAVEQRVELVLGDWLLIFSDGVPEAMNEQGEEFGNDSLLRTLHRSANGTAAQVCEVILTEIQNHTRAQRQQDDVTLAAIRIL